MRKLWKQRCITHKAVLLDSVNKVVLFLKALKSKYANFRSTSQFLWIERSRTLARWCHFAAEPAAYRRELSRQSQSFSSVWHLFVMKEPEVAEEGRPRICWRLSLLLLFGCGHETQLVAVRLMLPSSGRVVYSSCLPQKISGLSVSLGLDKRALIPN